MDIPTLVKKRTLHKGKLIKIQALINQFNSSNPIDETAYDSLLQEISTINAKVDEIQEEIAIQCTTDQELEAQIDVSEWFTVKILNLKSKLKEVKTVPVTSGSSSSHSSDHVKLPRIELPTFDGRFELWQSFQDLFIATVEKNNTLSEAQKLQYLKSCVKGEAANLIKSFPVTDQSYREAWEILTNRFDNQREIVQAVLKRLHNQPFIKSESASALQKMLDVTNECLRSLKVLGRSVDEWDDLIVFMLVEKMDSDSRREWAMKLKGSNPPTFKQLSDFLELHIRGLNAGGAQSSSALKPKAFNQVGGRQQQAHSHLGVSDVSCSVCKNAHHIHQCSVFRGQSAEERAATVKAKKLCVNCLREGHWVQKCKSNCRCRTCGRKHHSLLHATRQPTTQPQETAFKPSQESVQSVQSHHYSLSQVLLKTALVTVVDNLGNKKTLRALLDDGSQGSFISEASARALGLPVEKTDVTIRGISASPVCSVHGQVKSTSPP